MRKKQNAMLLFLSAFASLALLTGCDFKENSVNDTTDLQSDLSSVNTKKSHFTYEAPDISEQSSAPAEYGDSVSSVSESGTESLGTEESPSTEYSDSEPKDFVPDETYDFMDGMNKIMDEVTDVKELKERVYEFDKNYNRVHHISVFTGDYDYHDTDNRVEVTEGELKDGMVIVVYSDENTPSWTKTINLFMEGLWKILDNAATVEDLKKDLEEFDKDYNRIHHICVFSDNNAENRAEITEGEILNGMVIVVYSDESTVLWQSDW